MHCWYGQMLVVDSPKLRDSFDYETLWIFGFEN